MSNGAYADYALDGKLLQACALAGLFESRWGQYTPQPSEPYADFSIHGQSGKGAGMQQVIPVRKALNICFYNHSTGQAGVTWVGNSTMQM